MASNTEDAPSESQTPRQRESQIHSDSQTSRPCQGIKARTNADFMFRNIHYHREIRISRDGTLTDDSLSRELEENELPQLHRAAATGDIEDVERVLSQGVDVNLPLKQNTHVPFKFGKVDSDYDITGCSALQIACYCGQVKAVRKLLERDATISHLDDMEGGAL